MGLTLVSENVLGDSIAAVGLMIAFYYGLTGFAAVWFYRQSVFRSLNYFVMRVLFPLLGGVMLLGAFVIASYQYAQPDYGNTTLWGIGGVFIIGIGTLLLGVVLMVIWSRIAPAFFRGQTLSQRSHSELILVRGGVRGGDRAPAGLRPAGSRHRPGPVEPPRGRNRHQPETGEEFRNP